MTRGKTIVASQLAVALLRPAGGHSEQGASGIADVPSLNGLGQKQSGSIK